MSFKARHRPALLRALGVATLTLLGSPSAIAQLSSPAMQSGILIDVHVAQAAQRFGIAEHWIWSVIRVESAGRIRATSSAGAMGLMQLMPATWDALRTKYGLGNDPYDAHDNIMAGAAYLREMHDRYGPTGMLAAYNAGPGRYEDHLLRGRPLPSETITYMAKLAPMVGSPSLSHSAKIAATPAAHWTQAALFAMQSASQDTGAKTVVHDAAKAPIDTPSTAPSTPETTPLKASPTGLFVPLSGSHRP